MAAVFFVMQQPNADLRHLTVHVSRSHTPARPPLNSDQPVPQAATCTTQDKHNIRTSMPSAGCEPAIPALKRLCTALPRGSAGYSIYFRNYSIP